METRRDVIVRAAALADQLGYELFVVPEGWGLDSTLGSVITGLAHRHSHVEHLLICLDRVSRIRRCHLIQRITNLVGRWGSKTSTGSTGEIYYPKKSKFNFIF